MLIKRVLASMKLSIFYKWDNDIRIFIDIIINSGQHILLSMLVIFCGKQNMVRVIVLLLKCVLCVEVLYNLNEHYIKQVHH